MLRRLISFPIENLSTMTLGELRSERLKNLGLSYVYYTVAPGCLALAGISWFGSYAIPMALSIGYAGSDINEKKSMRILDNIHNIIKWGGILAFGGGFILCCYKTGGCLSRVYTIQKEIYRRMDKIDK